MRQLPGSPVSDLRDRELQVGDRIAWCARNELRLGQIVKINKKIKENSNKEIYETVSLRVDNVSKGGSWILGPSTIVDLNKVVKLD